MKKMNISNKIKGFNLKMVLTLVALVVVNSQSFALDQAISDATTEITDAWDSLKTLVYIIGGVVGLIGSIQIYQKFTNGDKDTTKHVVGWVGACLFLFLVPELLETFFDLA